MLTLSADGRLLDLPNDISITLKFASPIFNTIGDYSYPFKLPATPRNIEILGYKHRIESASDPFAVFDAIMEWNGTIIVQGTLSILVAQSDVYEACLYMDKGDFFYRKKIMTLQDVDFGSMAWTGETLKINYFNDCRNYVYPERNFCFPQILNKSYYDTMPDDPFSQSFNYYYYGALNYFLEDVDRTILVPMLYFRYVLELVFKKLDYQLDDSFFATDPEFNSLAIYNNVDANCALAGLFNYDVKNVFMNYHTPRMGVNDFLIGIETFFNLRFFVNNITKTVKLVSVDKIVKSCQAIDFSSNVSSIYTQIGTPVNGFHLKMNMETDDQAWTQALEGQSLILDAIKGSVNNITDLPLWPASPNNEIRFVRSEGAYYIMSSRAWTAIFLNASTATLHSEFIHSESDKTVETKFSTLMNVATTPYDCIIGSSQSAWATVGPKLFFVKLHEWNEVPPEDDRVFASNFSASHSLFYSGENGLYLKHFKAFFDFQMASKQVKIIKQMTLLELNQLDFSNKYAIDGNKYLLSEVQVTITNQGFKPATIVAYTCL